MIPNRFKSLRPMMISFERAGEMMALVVVERFPAISEIFAVPSIGTGSPQTLMYRVFGFLPEVVMPYRLATSPASTVAADPVSGKVAKLK